MSNEADDATEGNYGSNKWIEGLLRAKLGIIERRRVVTGGGGQEENSSSSSRISIFSFFSIPAVTDMEFKTK